MGRPPLFTMLSTYKWTDLSISLGLRGAAAYWLRLAVGSEDIPLTANALASRESRWTSPG